MNTKTKKQVMTVVKGLICALLLLIALFPIYWLVAMAIRPTSEMTGHISIIPHSLTIEHFKALFVSRGFGQAIANSLQTTLSSLVLSLAVGICAAYAIARRRFHFRIKKPMTYWILLVRVLPPVAFTIPLYTMFSKVGILNTKLPVTLACVLINVPLIIWFLISFFQDLPEEAPRSGSSSCGSSCPWWPRASRRWPCSASCTPGTSTPTPSSSPGRPPTTRCPWRCPC